MFQETNYETAIKQLNNLQTGRHPPATTNSTPINKLYAIRKYLERVGIDQKRLDTLSIIHITGTKGKGTTCAFTEAILRQHGFKTGFYSSPHLLEVRERIRINGKVLSKNEFAAYFWRVHSLLDRKKEHDCDIPLYFGFLTVMAFLIFLEAELDVVILEVGIGGEFDCTNVVKNVPVLGINTIDIDHTAQLGSTLDSIAWHKSGIMKNNCQAFTVQQRQEAMEVLEIRAVEKKCTLRLIEKIKEYSIFPSEIVNLNASLAVNLSKTWLEIKNRILLPEETKLALSKCIWPGRYDIKARKNIKFYLDGAHTVESIKLCVQWYKENTSNSLSKKALIFNVIGGRDPEIFMKQLITCSFDCALFVANRSHKIEKKCDNYSVKMDEQLNKLETNKDLWTKLQKSKEAETFSSVEEAVEYLGNEEAYDLLVTGSLHLIGAVLSLIQPDLNDLQ